MRKEEARTDIGVVRIHKNVIASIAAQAAMEIDGVKRIGGHSQGFLREILDKKNAQAIRVEFDRNGEAKIDIPLVVRYGHHIPDIASSVQENARQALEKMTNVVVRDIDISVRGIEKD